MTGDAARAGSGSPPVRSAKARTSVGRGACAQAVASAPARQPVPRYGANVPVSVVAYVKTFP